MYNPPYSRAVVLMTALVPTKGHKDLIDYARQLAGRVDVIVSSRSFEPVSGDKRVKALEKTYGHETGVYIYHHADDSAPQSPETFSGLEEEFWSYWKNIIFEIGGVNQRQYPVFEIFYDVVVASESYGHKLAEVLGIKFMPYDLNREINSVKGTDVRNNLISNFDKILPEFQKNLVTTATIFGAESCWKTSIVKEIHDFYPHLAHTLPEWARPYLESLSNPEVAPEHMEDITEGQYAMQMNSKYNMYDKPFIMQDTDLLSTIGYYRIMNIPIPEKIENYFKRSKSDIYFLSKSNVPFVPDPLRYGGDKRESDDQFWIDLLEEYGCNYVVLDQDSSMERAFIALIEMRAFATKKFEPIKNFVRD